ncbi:hypothetical protein UPYG_G00010360 [Umbra pygmaea]|uniref:Uncharacterized protein n=1 Tax=Umbra pygmaea TaxID=75934 RepID=A0ABD0XIE8_UMBPY
MPPFQSKEHNVPQPHQKADQRDVVHFVPPSLSDALHHGADTIPRGGGVHYHRVYILIEAGDTGSPAISNTAPRGTQFDAAAPEAWPPTPLPEVLSLPSTPEDLPPTPDAGALCFTPVVPSTPELPQGVNTAPLTTVTHSSSPPEATVPHVEGHGVQGDKTIPWFPRIFFGGRGIGRKDSSKGATQIPQGLLEKDDSC